MADVKVQLDDAMGTSLIMLYGLAQDAHAKSTILGDTTAAEAFDKVDYDFARLKLQPSVGIAVSSRAKVFDDWTTEFLRQHTRATVVNMGAGLDSRVWRVNPGPDVRWYDVDYQGVIDVRTKIFPERENYQLIGSSVTDPDWLAQIPNDLPTMVIAQGLTMYLQPDDGHALFRRVTDHFGPGVLLLDTHNAYAIRRQNKLVNRLFGATLHWAINDPSDLEVRNPALHCTNAISGLAPLADTSLSVGYKLLVKVAQSIPTVRTAGLYVRYEFNSSRAAP